MERCCIQSLPHFGILLSRLSLSSTYSNIILDLTQQYFCIHDSTYLSQSKSPNCSSIHHSQVSVVFTFSHQYYRIIKKVYRSHDKTFYFSLEISILRFPELQNIVFIKCLSVYYLYVRGQL